jgi:hypothetical protein
MITDVFSVRYLSTNSDTTLYCIQFIFQIITDVDMSFSCLVFVLCQYFMDNYVVYVIKYGTNIYLEQSFQPNENIKIVDIVFPVSTYPYARWLGLWSMHP